MAGNRNSGMCSPLWCVCAFLLPPRHYIKFIDSIYLFIYLFVHSFIRLFIIDRETGSVNECQMLFL